jgi:hypothetical protein
MTINHQNLIVAFTAQVSGSNKENIFSSVKLNLSTFIHDGKLSYQSHETLKDAKSKYSIQGIMLFVLSAIFSLIITHVIFNS